ncbi:MAG: hypothetical protein BWY53_00474 [Parcubacteria group bacterium ADurb.Bin326]|nr:MAG: hypothetical protein BWY53_00474 [Parcubacteria group bacterium ADurb.Bin326]
MNGTEPQGHVLGIAEMLAITQRCHEANAQPAKKTEVSVADLDFTKPASLIEINQAIMREGYKPLPDKMLLAAARERSTTLYCLNEKFVLERA